jgi:hypothetical protein
MIPNMIAKIKANLNLTYKSSTNHYHKNILLYLTVHSIPIPGSMKQCFIKLLQIRLHQHHKMLIFLHIITRKSSNDI